MMRLDPTAHAGYPAGLDEPDCPACATGWHSRCCSPDLADDGDGELHHVPAHDEVTEFSEHVLFSHSWICSRGSMAGADSLHCLVEVPKGSRNKYEWDERLQAIKLARFLFSSVVYPTDYGFIQGTLTEKGSALDAMVCVGAPTFPGIVIPVKAIAVFRTRDEAGQDDKVLCVPHEDPNWNHMEELDDLPKGLRTEIEHFWSIYKEPEGKPVEIQGWEDRSVAFEVIEAARGRRADAG